MAKTKEMVGDFRRNRSKPNTISMLGEEVAVVEGYRYLCVHLANRLDWKHWGFLAAIGWGSSIRASDTKNLNKLKKASSVLGTALQPLQLVVERKMIHKLLNITDNTSHPPARPTGQRAECFSAGGFFNSAVIRTAKGRNSCPQQKQYIMTPLCAGRGGLSS